MHTGNTSWNERSNQPHGMTTRNTEVSIQHNDTTPCNLETRLKMEKWMEFSYVLSAFSFATTGMIGLGNYEMEFCINRNCDSNTAALATMVVPLYHEFFSWLFAISDFPLTCWTNRDPWQKIKWSQWALQNFPLTFSF